MKKILTELIAKADVYLGKKTKSPYFPFLFVATVLLFTFVFPAAAFILMLALLILGPILLRITRVNK